jgi:hypothetical protein
MSENINYLSESLLWSSHVDKSSGFPNQILITKYILVANPVQLHLPEGQEVVSYFASKIINGQDVQNLKPIKVFELEPNITVTVYERMGGYSLEFLEDAKDHFTTLYPDYANLTNIDFINSME